MEATQFKGWYVCNWATENAKITVVGNADHIDTRRGMWRIVIGFPLFLSFTELSKLHKQWVMVGAYALKVRCFIGDLTASEKGQVLVYE